MFKSALCLNECWGYGFRTPRLLGIVSIIFSRLYMRVCPFDGWTVGRSVTSYFFGLLGATNAVYTALFLSFSLSFLTVPCPFWAFPSFRILIRKDRWEVLSEDRKGHEADCLGICWTQRELKGLKLAYRGMVGPWVLRCMLGSLGKMTLTSRWASPRTCRSYLIGASSDGRFNWHTLTSFIISSWCRWLHMVKQPLLWGVWKTITHIELYRYYMY